MPFPFIFAFGEGIALPFITGGVYEGLTAEEIGASLAEKGIIVPSDRLNTLVNTLQTDKLTDEEYFQQLPSHVFPDITRIPESINKIDTNFSYTVKIPGQSADFVNIPDNFITIRSANVLTKDQVLSEAYGIVEADPKKYDFQLDAAEVIAVCKNSVGLTLP